MAHTRDRGKGDQTHEQCVFNQVLAFFAMRQVLQLQIKLQKETVHVFPRVFEVPGAAGARRLGKEREPMVRKAGSGRAVPAVMLNASVVIIGPMGASNRSDEAGEATTLVVGGRGQTPFWCKRGNSSADSRVSNTPETRCPWPQARTTGILQQQRRRTKGNKS